MKTTALATMTALAALLVVSPGVSSDHAQAASIKVNKAKAPRIRVRPKIRVNLNTKRLVRKKPAKTHVVTAPARTTAAPAGRLPAADPGTFSLEPSFADAITELGEKLAHIDPNGFDVSGIVRLDVAAVNLAFPVAGLDDEDDADAPLPGGIRPPGPDTAWNPNDVLPGDNRPDSSHLGVSVEDAKSGVTHGGGRRVVRRTDTGEVWSIGPGYFYRTRSVEYSDGSSLFHELTVDRDTRERHEWSALYDKHGNVVAWSGNPPPEDTYSAETERPELTEDSAPQNTTESDSKPDSGKPSNDPTKLYDPDYVGGGEVIPVNCGSVACNEARNGKGPGVIRNPHVQVLTGDPADNQTSIVGQAPRTDKYWRDKATTNPGSDPHDSGDAQPVKTNNDQVLVLDEADAPQPSTPGG